VSCAWPPVNRKSSSQARSGAVNRRAPRLANVVPPANCAAHWCRRKGMESEAVSWAVASIGDRTNAQQIAKREANARASGEGVGAGGAGGGARGEGGGEGGGGEGEEAGGRGRGGEGSGERKDGQERGEREGKWVGGGGGGGGGRYANYARRAWRLATSSVL